MKMGMEYIRCDCNCNSINVHEKCLNCLSVAQWNSTYTLQNSTYYIILYKRNGQSYWCSNAVELTWNTRRIPNDTRFNFFFISFISFYVMENSSTIEMRDCWMDCIAYNNNAMIGSFHRVIFHWNRGK